MKTAAEIGQAILERFAAQAAANRDASAVLRTEIMAAMQAYTGSGRLTAKRVLALLKRRPLPSVRTVQDHMRAIRAREPPLR